MIEFYISQVTALILEENVKVSPLLKTQTRSAPIKADIWRLRCEKDELIELNQKLELALERNSQINPEVKVMVIEELAQICKEYI